MDTSTIDQAYQQLQTEFQDVANSIQTLALRPCATRPVPPRVRGPYCSRNSPP